VIEKRTWHDAQCVRSMPLYMEEECFGSLGCSCTSSKLADEQVGETVPGPSWLYPRHADAV